MSRRFLVVDDAQLNRKLVLAMLKREGWNGEEAEDGTQALAQLETSTYDLIVLDISMPGIGGEDVCRQIRKSPKTASLPVIAYTAHALEDEKARILSAGFDAILVKPITAATLQSAVLEALNARNSGKP